MSLDVKVMQMLDRYARLDVKSDVKDVQALDYLNGIPLPPSQVYLKTEYMKYYFKAKKDYQEKQEEPGYGHGV